MRKYKNTFEQNEIKDIIDKYVNNNLKLKEIANLYNSERHIISQLLHKNKIKINQNKSSLNCNYFEKIDTELKAYFVGFILADGCVYCRPSSINSYFQKRLSIDIHLNDKCILDKLKSELNSVNKILINEKRKHCNISFTSNKLCNDLINLGITPRKSLTAKFDISKIPDNLVNHFIRGLFDGDGSVSYCMFKNNKMSSKSFKIYGTYDVCNMAKNELIKITRNYCTVSPSSTIYSFSCQNFDGIKDIHDYLYKNAIFYLKRKKEKFEFIINYRN